MPLLQLVHVSIVGRVAAAGESIHPDAEFDQDFGRSWVIVIVLWLLDVFGYAFSVSRTVLANSVPILAPSCQPCCIPCFLMWERPQPYKHGMFAGHVYGSIQREFARNTRKGPLFRDNPQLEADCRERTATPANGLTVPAFLRQGNRAFSTFQMNTGPVFTLVPFLFKQTKHADP
jgi:hypothetical protein